MRFVLASVQPVITALRGLSILRLTPVAWEDFIVQSAALFPSKFQEAIIFLDRHQSLDPISEFAGKDFIALILEKFFLVHQEHSEREKVSLAPLDLFNLVKEIPFVRVVTESYFIFTFFRSL
jgi:hypothetical protein